MNPTTYIGNVAFKGTSSAGSFETELFLRLAAISENLERAFFTFEVGFGGRLIGSTISKTNFDSFVDDGCGDIFVV